MSIFPLGGVDVTQDSVIITYWDGSKKNLWVLADSGGQGASKVAFQNPITVNSSSKVSYDTSVVPLVYKVVLSSPESSSASATFTQVGGTGNLDLAVVNLSTGVLVTGDSTAATFVVTQQSFQPWNNPPSLLTGTSYKFTTTDSVNASWEFLDNNGNPSVKIVSVGFLPISYFYGCTTSGGSSTSQSVSEVVTLAYCSLSGQLQRPVCSQIPTTSAWVSQDDCVAGNVYSYCATGTSCSGTCKSQSCSSGQQCLLGTDKSYSCGDSSGNNPSGSSSSKLWIVIAIVVGVVALIALVFIFKLIFGKKNKDKTEAKGLDDDNDFEDEAP